MIINHVEAMPKASIERDGVERCRQAALGMARHHLADEMLRLRLVTCVQKPDPDNPDQVLFTFSVEVVDPK